MKLNTILLSTPLLLLSTSCQDKIKQSKTENPNIVIIYMDDLGYGDMSSYGATEISTPNMDKLANGGVRFTNGYSSSATSTPSRYALLTGEYPWRNKQAQILPGSAPLIIETTKMTLPRMLKEKGYSTAVIGKWHLGLGVGDVDWNKQVSPGPNELGFDYSFIMAATQDRTPTVYLENGYVVGLNDNDPLYVSYERNFEGEPTGLENPELCKMMWDHGHNNSIHNGIPRIGFQKGGKSAMWVDENMADDFLGKVKEYIKGNKENPFFLLYTLHQPHVPRTPNPRFVGSSGMGPRGDVILEADWCIGELMNTLENEGILENTLIIFSSDNGPVVNDGYKDESIEKLGNHTPWGPLRGGKYSLFEAGTRVPFVTYWKGVIDPSVNDGIISQLDIISSLAKLVDSDKTGPDSQNLLDLFLGKDIQGREELVIEATTRTAFRKNNWVMIPPYNGPEINQEVNIELGNSKDFQLYNLDNDIEQRNNLAESEPKILSEMVEEFQEIRGEEFNNIQQLELK